MIFQLSDDIVFPDPRMGEEDGLLAVGGDLSVDRLILAYSYGIFPWFSFRDWPEPAWYCPMQRFVVFPDEIHVSHSMRTLMNKSTYRVTFNRDFDGVIQGCSQVDNRYYIAGAWLDENMMTAYRHPLIKSLCEVVGEPLISTSANKSKEVPCKTYRETICRLGNLVDYVVEGCTLGYLNPSTIIDLKSKTVIRKG